MHRFTRSSACRHRRRNHIAPTRGGFTLVEILMVIIILGILMALLLPAINRAKVTANEARVVSEIKQLESAITAFKVEYGVEPPSKMQIFLTQAGWDNNPYYKGIIKRMWPQFDFSMGTPGTNYPTGGSAVITNWPGTTLADGSGNQYVGMNSGECLMFFLGGILYNGAPSGFAKNPAYPFSPPSAVANRKGPFLEFDPNRIKDSDGNGVPEFFDPLPNQTSPYLYFSSYEGNGYRVAGTVANIELPLDGTGTNFTALHDVYRTSSSAATPPTAPQATASGSQTLAAQKPQTFQIISPGYDANYGFGGVYNNSATTTLSNNGLQSPFDYDNLTNFASGRLKP